jgi:hypothetical protein
MAEALGFFKGTALPADKTERAAALKEFDAKLAAHPEIKKMREEVRALASSFPVPGIK